MTVVLRDEQQDCVNQTYAAWNTGKKNVLLVKPTGTGKTVTFAHMIREMNRPTVSIAHRAELVGQASLALARNEIRHSVLASAALISEIQSMHMVDLGRRYIDPHSNVIVAGVATIVNRQADWMQKIGLWVCDEAHHLIRDNVWGRAVAMLPNALGLGVTATPLRADGKGLGRHADGVMDDMVVGIGMRESIDRGYLSDYRIFAPPSDLNMDDVKIGASGDYVSQQVRKAVHRSHITGDIVQHYLRLAPGKRGITFTVDVEAAEETAKAYRDAGVRAEVLTGESPTAWRIRVMRALRSGEILQVVNCDLLGEGTDVPAVEVVSFGRPTASYGLYVQQFGRPLRPLEGKTHAIIIDHVNNVRRHGLPDSYREWTLDRRERSSRNGPSDAIPVTTCTNCTGVYERIFSQCPYCGNRAEPAARSSPAFVDGELAELDAETLDRMRGEIARVDAMALIPQALRGTPAQGAIMNNHAARQLAQRELRQVLDLYGGWRTALGESIGMAQRRFYLTFGVDVWTAKTLNAKDADELRAGVHEIIMKGLAKRY